MRIARLFSALVLFFFFSGATVAAQSPRTLSDLPVQAQAKIRAAFSRHRPSFPMRAATGNVPTDGPWVQLAQPVRSSDQGGYYFGGSVAVSGDTLVIGQIYSYYGATGVALVFVKPANNDWNNLTEAAVLTPAPPEGFNADLFATSVAISGNTIVVGSPPYSTCRDCGAGTAYVYVKPAGGWAGQLTQTAELTASDGVNGAILGTSVAILGDTVVAGAPGTGGGAAYVYVKPAGGWTNMTQTAELTASDGIPGSQLGDAISVDGTTIVAGAPQAPTFGLGPVGAAYVFTEPSTGWKDMTQTAVLLPSDGVQYADFAQAVAVEDKVIAVGSPRANGVSPTTGATYIFIEPAGGWKNAYQTAKLIAPDGQGGDAFGSAVVMSRNMLVVGAPQRSSTSQGFNFWRQGGSYVFTASGSGWTNDPVQVFSGSDAHTDDEFGQSLAIDGDLLVAGAPYLGKGEGGAFLFINLSAVF